MLFELPGRQSVKCSEKKRRLPRRVRRSRGASIETSPAASTAPFSTGRRSVRSPTGGLHGGVDGVSEPATGQAADTSASRSMSLGSRTGDPGPSRRLHVVHSAVDSRSRGENSARKHGAGEGRQPRHYEEPPLWCGGRRRRAGNAWDRAYLCQVSGLSETSAADDREPRPTVVDVRSHRCSSGGSCPPGACSVVARAGGQGTKVMTTDLWSTGDVTRLTESARMSGTALGAGVCGRQAYEAV